MNYLPVIIFLFFGSFTYSQNCADLNIKKGNWHAELQLNKEDVLPFEMTVVKKKKNYSFIVHNGEEMITLDSVCLINDTVHVPFPVFNSELIFTVINKKEIKGNWYNYNKGNNYKIAFTSNKSKSERFSFVNKKSVSADFAGKWEVTFEPNTNSAYPALGLFEQEGAKLSGTFLTETGDYRYLAGNSYNDSLFLSCFDGSHAFLFKADYSNDTLNGVFLSGNHWKSNWIGVKNENFELSDPEKLTYLVDDKKLEFSLPDLNGDTLYYPNSDYTNKVVIIQIMGSWCPNCLDETKFFKELFEQYHSKGLEIISIGYETGDSFEDYVANIERLKNRLDLDFTFLVGGSASKNLAEQEFDMLNHIISFPTTIFVDRDGEVKRVHTGFSGPGTGIYYEEYIKKTNALIESLLAN